MAIKKAVKRLGIFLLVIAVLLLSAHLYITYRANQLFSRLISSVSNGKYQGEAKAVHFKYFPLSITAAGVHVEPAADSIKQKNYCTVQADTLFGKVHSLYSLLFNKDLSIDEIRIVKPILNIYDAGLDTTTATENRPVRHAINDVKNVMLRTFEALEVKRFSMTDLGFHYYTNAAKNLFYRVNHINLFIDNFKMAYLPGPDSASSVQADLVFSISDPDVQYPDSTLKVDVRSLQLNTIKNSFTIESFSLAKSKPGSDSFVTRIQQSHLQISGVNWQRWFSDGTVEVDKVEALDGQTIFDLTGNKKLPTAQRRQRFDSAAIIKFLSPLVVHELQINKVQHNLRARGGNGNFSMSLLGDSLRITELVINDTLEKPVQFAGLSLRVNDFIQGDDKSTYDAGFSRLVINNNELILENYRLETLPGSPYGSNYKLHIPQLKLYDFELDELMRARLVASRMSLEAPELSIIIPAEKKTRKPAKDFTELMASLRPVLAIGSIDVSNANVLATPERKNGVSFNLSRIDAVINVDRMFAATQPTGFIYAATRLNADRLGITGPGMFINVSQPVIKPGLSVILLQKINGAMNNGAVKFNLQNVQFIPDKKILEKNNDHSFVIPELIVGSGDVFFNTNIKSNHAGASAFMIERLEAPSLNVHVEGNGFTAGVQQLKAGADRFVVNKTGVSWTRLQLQSPGLQFSNASTHIKTGKMVLEQPGNITLANVVMDVETDSTNLHISASRIVAAAAYNNGGFKHINLQRVYAEKPVFTGVVHTGRPGATAPLPGVNIGEVILKDAVIKADMINKDHITHIKANGNTIRLTGVHTDTVNQQLLAASISAVLSNPLFSKDSAAGYTAGGAAISASNFSYGMASRMIQARVDSLQLHTLALKIPGKKDSFDVTLQNVGIAGYDFKSDEPVAPADLLHHNNWWARGVNISKPGALSNIQLTNFHINRFRHTAGWDSLTWMPEISRDSFWNSFAYIKDYLTVRLGPTRIFNWRVIDSAGNMYLSAQRVDNAYTLIQAERNRQKPFDTISYRPLLARSLQQLAVNFAVDTMYMNDGYIRYNEIGEKTGQEGYLFFDQVRGSFINIKNYGYVPLDTLQLKLESRLMGTGDLRMSFRQSYNDSLQGFHMLAQMRQFNLPDLNSILIPSVSVKINRGFADSMWMRVEANDYTAFGLMDLRYHNLKLSVLKKGQEKFFLSGAANWLANLILHSSSKSEPGIVYRARWRDRSTFNYWAKIAISGLLTNLGIKKEKKQIKKYKRLPNRPSLPEFPANF